MPLELGEFHRQNHYQQYRDLFLLAFPETRSTPVSTGPHYRWKFDSFPAKPPSYEFAAVHERRLVGYYAALPYGYVVKGHRRLCGMVCDVMTHPEMRGQGVFTKLGRFSTESLREKGVEFVSGYPIRPEVIPGHLKVGWSVAFRQPVYVRPIAAKALAARWPWARPFVPIADRLLHAVNGAVSGRSRSDYRVDLLSRDDFLRDPGYDGFFGRWAEQQSTYLIKDRSFLAWRTGAPGAAYRFLKLSKGDEFAGLAIARATNLQGIASLAVLDLMVPREHLRGVRSLHTALLRQAQRDHCEVVAAMMSPTLAVRYGLVSNFYLRSSAVFSVIFKALSSEMAAGGFGAEADWHLMWIDSDDL